MWFPEPSIFWPFLTQIQTSSRETLRGVVAAGTITFEDLEKFLRGLVPGRSSHINPPYSSMYESFICCSLTLYPFIHVATLLKSSCHSHHRFLWVTLAWNDPGVDGLYQEDCCETHDWTGMYSLLFLPSMSTGKLRYESESDRPFPVIGWFMILFCPHYRWLVNY